MGLFDGKVVIVTGAGGGLGRAHALAFAAEGAKLVVNDLGGTRDGSGEGTAMADLVVAEIREAGGEAVASYDNVATMSGGENITKIALDSFGRIDVLINNAGILRDKSFAKMEESMWDLVMQVHTKQLYAVTRPVYLHMLSREGGGTIVNTTSLAGLLGNYGQTNYATAKAGVAGFTRTLAKEGRKKGIRVNAVAPVAKTRMTDDIAMVPDDMKPEHITPMVAFLASDLSEGVTGRIFGVHGNQMFEYKMTQTDGVTKDGLEPWGVQELADQFDAITRDQEPVAAAASGPDEVTLAFAQIPKGFKADAAGSWTANLHWIVKGATDQTLQISDGRCEHGAGLVGTPTCTIKTDKDTVVGMFSGTVDPTKAFMAGKLAADNLADMMKMGSAFDFQAIGAAIAEAMAGDGSGGKAPADPVAEAFELLPLAFLAEKAGDWTATFHFVIKGGTDHTMAIADGTCTTEAGLQGTATCTIKTDAATIVGMLDGSLDGTKAFMAGKITADNMGELMKFSSNFRMDASAADVKAAKAARGAAKPAPAKKAIDLREAIGRTYRADYVMVREDWIKAFAAATNDPNPRYTEGDVVASPMFPVRLFHPLMFKCAGDPDLNLDMLRLVHGEQDMTWHGPIRAGDIVNLRGVLESVAQKSKGCVVAWRMLGIVDGETRVEARMSVYVRGQMLPGVAPGEVFGSVPPGASGDPQGDPVATSTMTVDMDQPVRYSAASLDENPIHLDESIAKAAGHPSVILHGLCTMSFAARGIVEELLDSDPSSLHRFGVRFTKPVLPGWQLTTSLYAAGTTDAGRKAYQVQVKNQDGVVVAANGWVEINASA
jgi:NAD(P)-dependent dehydrogenase (short-subunit alcohol dehydrogenase family)/acyl dehydratase/putative sterol carrier protein